MSISIMCDEPDVLLTIHFEEDGEQKTVTLANAFAESDEGVLEEYFQTTLNNPQLSFNMTRIEVKKIPSVDDEHLEQFIDWVSVGGDTIETVSLYMLTTLIEQYEKTVHWDDCQKIAVHYLVHSAGLAYDDAIRNARHVKVSTDNAISHLADIYHADVDQLPKELQNVIDWGKLAERAIDANEFYPHEGYLILNPTDTYE